MTGGYALAVVGTGGIAGYHAEAPAPTILGTSAKS